MGTPPGRVNILNFPMMKLRNRAPPVLDLHQMIRSFLIETPLRLMCHEISNTPQIEDVSLAIKHTLQHDELPVLWDLRKMDLHEGLLVYEEGLRSLIGEWRLEMSGKKRAFLMVDADAARIFEAVLGRLRGPWPWAVFENWAIAIEWLGQD